MSYNNKKQGELDFLIERSGEVLPIEIKSGKNFSKHAALENVLENKRYGIKEAFVFYNGNVEMHEKVVYYPVYMLMFLEEESAPEEMVYRIDLEGLR